MMCITSRVGETGSSLGGCGALKYLCGGCCLWLNWLISVNPEQEAPCRGLGCAMYVRAPCHRHICKTFLLSQDFLPLSFSLPHEEGLSDSICSGNSCLNFVKSFNTWRTRRKQHVLDLGLLLHLCAVVQHCLFCLLPKRTLSTGANSYI